MSNSILGSFANATVKTAAQMYGTGISITQDDFRRAFARSNNDYADYLRMAYQEFNNVGNANGIPKDKKFEGNPGSVMPKEILSEAVRIQGDAIRNRVAMFV